jgi:uncharacterized protein YraI
MLQLIRKIIFSGFRAHKVVALALVATSIHAAASKAAPTFEPTAQFRVVQKVYLNVRDGAGTDYEIVGVIPPAAPGVNIDDCIGGWCHIAWRGVTGWVNARFLRPEAHGLPSWLQSSHR